MNIEIKIIKRIMSEKKTALPSRRNEDWKIVKAETENINELLILSSTNPRLNELIYAGANLVSDKIGVS